MSSQGFNYSGAEVTWEVPYTAEYTITAFGASGGIGNCYNTNYGSVAGKGAKITSVFSLTKGDKLRINAGGIGTGNTGTAKDGVSGGGGGGTFVFLEIPSITNSDYEFTKGTAHLRPLLVAAGGGGTWDESYKGSRGDGKGGVATTYYSPTNFIKYETTTQNPSTTANLGNGLSISQYISYDLGGCTYTRNGSTGQGGFGGGTASDDSYGCGGGWYSSGAIAYSWSYTAPTETVDGANEGNGSVIIEYNITPPAPTTAPTVTTELKKNTINITAIDGASSYRLYRNNSFLNVISNTYLMYTDTDVVPGTSYTYKYSYIKDGFESELSAGTAVTAYQPPSPTVTRTNEVGYIKLTWDKVDNASSYIIYKRNNDNTWGDEPLVVLTPDILKYNDYDVEYGVFQFYRITYILDGVESKYRAISGRAITPIIATPPTVISTNEYIKIIFEGDTNVTKYNLYRNDILIYSSETAGEYIDTDVEVNVGYYYRLSYIVTNVEHPKSSSVFGAIYKMVTDRTNINEYYNAVDLNRVETKCKETAEILGTVGYKCYGDYKTNWKDLNELDSSEFNENEWVTVSQMNRFMNNLQLIKNEFCYPPYVDLPETMNYLTYIGANNIEKFLLLVYNCYINMKHEYKYCGLVTCGYDSLPQYTE